MSIIHFLKTKNNFRSKKKKKNEFKKTHHILLRIEVTMFSCPLYIDYIVI